MKFSVVVGLALCAPSLALRNSRVIANHTVGDVDCATLADFEADGKKFGQTLEKVCQFWPAAKLGEFPMSNLEKAGNLFGKVMDEGGVWDQIKQARADKEDHGFCWRKNTQRSGGECPLGFKTAGFTGLFKRTCKTGCMWSSHTVSCGFGCATDRRQCASALAEQTALVAQGVSKLYGWVTGDTRINRAVTALMTLSEFLLQTLPPIIDAVRGAFDILEKNEQGVMVTVVLFQYLQETAKDVSEPAESIRDAIQHFGSVIAELTQEKFERGSISPRSIIRVVKDHGESMLDFGVRATKVFTHPTCSVTDDVAFTMETAGDDRLLGPWVQRGEEEGHPRYTLLGDRSTNLEWSKNRWVMFSDGLCGHLCRKILYESIGPSNDYPLSGWKTVEGAEPVPEFVPVNARAD